MTVHIFDIDTTIADNTKRAELLEKTCVVCLGPKPQEFHAPCPTCGRATRSHIPQDCWDRFDDPDMLIQDEPVLKAVRFVRKLRAHSSSAEIHFLTGRSEKNRDATEFWLREYFGLRDGEQLIMRPQEEWELLASLYKDRAFNRLKESHYKKNWQEKLFFFYEDDPHCLDMYQKHGIVVRCPEAWEHLMPDAGGDAELPFSII